MSIKKYTNVSGYDLSHVSLSETYYILNSYIEETCNDALVKMFTSSINVLEGYADGAKDYIKLMKSSIIDAVNKVTNVIMGIIHRIVEFLSHLWDTIRIKLLGKGPAGNGKGIDRSNGATVEALKNFIQSMDNGKFNEIVNDTVDYFYNIDDIVEAVIEFSGAAERSYFYFRDFDNFMNKSSDKLVAENFETKPSDIISKKYIIDYISNGFKNDADLAKKTLNEMISTIENGKNETLKYMDNQSPEQKIVFKEAIQKLDSTLKMYNRASNLCSKCLISNAKKIEKIIYAIEKKFIAAKNN